MHIMKGGECFMNIKIVKAIGLVSSLVCVVATLASNWANEKQTDAKIAEKVAEAVANIAKKES
jgi:hypothetical protein